MELWIRSQDKKILTKVNEINIDYNEETKIICNHYMYGEECENYINLGIYKSKERALEVLDEIQHRLITLCDSMNRHLYVYEMPKE